MKVFELAESPFCKGKATDVIDTLIVFKLGQISQIVETASITITSGSEPVALTKNQCRSLVEALELDVEALRPFATLPDNLKNRINKWENELDQADAILSARLYQRSNPDDFRG
ncbi:hypothetical protein [Phnomibacter sp. MR]|uniref:hypothetical protein n=1 Tax=Phnomibacter sp. MR TaxID=3042318 RepID=UPI003A801A37